VIHVIATIEVAEGKRNDFLKIVHKVVPKIRAEEGCLEYGPTIEIPTGFKAQIPVRENVVTMVEKWADLKALEAHLSAPHMIAYREEVKGVVVSTKLQVLQTA
jgi:quinol monooxygenase YgiN